MSESVSRYSIVERLCTRKLNLIDDKLRINNDIENKKNEHEKQINEIIEWEKQIELNVIAEKKKREIKIQELNTELNFLNSQKEAKEEAIELKMEEVDNALERLETISASAEKEAQK